MILSEKYFSKHRNKAEFKNLLNSEVLSSDFSGLRTSAASVTSTASTTSVASMTWTASFHQKLTDSAGLMIPGTNMTITGPFLRNGSSEIQIFTDFSTFSVRGCWGRPILYFWKLIRETQISKPPDASRHHYSTTLLILLPLRADLLCTLHYETPCTRTRKHATYWTHRIIKFCQAE